MNKQDIYNLLDRENIPYKAVEHEAVYTIEGMLALNLPHSDRVAKNLFLRDDKKNFYLLTVREDLKINLKEVSALINSRRLSFASETQLGEIMGVIPGAVTPLGVLNDGENRVSVYIDSYFCGGIIGMHPVDNTATVYMDTDRLAQLITPHCKSFEFIKFD